MCFTIIPLILSLVGCGNSKKTKIEEVEVKDIEIVQATNYLGCDDAIVSKSYNGYQCVDTFIEYDEESGTYICAIKFKKIISNE